MAEPIVFISHNRIKEGKLEEFREVAARVTSELDRAKPRTLVFASYAADDGAVTFIHVFEDAGAMDDHVAGAEERSAVAYEYIVPERLEIFGRASEAVVEGMRQAEARGVSLTLHEDVLGGFLRVQQG